VFKTAVLTLKQQSLFLNCGLKTVNWKSEPYFVFSFSFDLETTIAVSQLRTENCKLEE